MPEIPTPSFNTTLVQLKGKLLQTRPRGDPCFNTTLVQLKGSSKTQNRK